MQILTLYSARQWYISPVEQDVKQMTVNIYVALVSSL